MSTQTTAMTTTDKPTMLLPRLASAAGLEPAKFYAAIKSTCGCDGATDESFAVLMMVADKYQLNPMLKQLYLMKTQKGVQVVIPVDGWVPMLVNFRDYLAHDVSLEWDGAPFKSRCVAATCRIWTKTRQEMAMGPFEHSEMMVECARDTGPWKSHPTRMLGHKAVIQATRRCFGIYVMDEDEARNIGEIRPVQNTGYSLPTDDKKNEQKPEPVIDVATESEDVKTWRVTIGCATTKDELAKLLGEFLDGRSGISTEDLTAIEELFGDQAKKLDAIPY